jgi:hypothetical protein
VRLALRMRLPKKLLPVPDGQAYPTSRHRAIRGPEAAVRLLLAYPTHDVPK